MQKMNKILIFGLLASLFLGELVRIPIINGIAFTLLDIVSGFIFILVLYRYFTTKHIFPVILKPLAIFLLICITSLLVNSLWLNQQQIFIASLYILRFSFLASVYFFVSSLPTISKKHLPFFMVFVSILLVIFGLVQYFYIDFATLKFLDWDIHWYRLFSTFIDPNFIGVFLCAPLFLALFKITKLKLYSKVSWFYILSAITLLVGILLTYSRTALLGLMAGLVSYFLTVKKARKVMLGIGACFAIGIAIILINYQATEGTKLFRLSSSKSRLTSAIRAITIIKDHPLFGVGFNAYRYAMHKYGFAVSDNWQYSHSDAGTDNSFLFILATTGVIGLTSYFYLLYIIMRKVLLVNRNVNSLHSVAFASFVTVCVSSLFLNALFYPLILAELWIVSGLTEPL